MEILTVQKQDTKTLLAKNQMDTDMIHIGANYLLYSFRRL